MRARGVGAKTAVYLGKRPGRPLASPQTAHPKTTIYLQELRFTAQPGLVVATHQPPRPTGQGNPHTAHKGTHAKGQAMHNHDRLQASGATTGSSASNLAAMFMVGRTSTQTGTARKVVATQRGGGTFTHGNRQHWQASTAATRAVAAAPYKCPGTPGNPCGATLAAVQGAPGSRLCHKCASAGVTVRHTTAAAATTAAVQRAVAAIAKLPASMRPAAVQRLRASNPAHAAKVAAALGL